MKGGGNFPGGQWEYLDRKEIWFYCALLIFYFSVKFFSNRPVLQTTIFTVVSILMILHHELFVFFSLILYTTLLISKNVKLRSIESLMASFYYLCIFVTFYLVFTFHGNEAISAAIWNSYLPQYSDVLTYPGRNWLNWLVNCTIARIRVTNCYRGFCSLLHLLCVNFYLVITHLHRCKIQEEN